MLSNEDSVRPPLCSKNCVPGGESLYDTQICKGEDMLRSLIRPLMGALLFALSSLPAHAGVEQKATQFVLCKSPNKEVRTIRILPESASPSNCTISYSKNGVEEVMGTNRALGTCQSILKNIQSNLENGNWSCRAVGSATVTTSSEVLRQ